MPLRKVVITGMGALSPFGSGVQTLMDHLYAGDSAVVSMKEAWEKKIKDLSCWIGAPVPGGIDAKVIERKFRRGMGPTAVLAYLASREALEQARVPEAWFPSGRMGVSFASTTGSVSCMERFFSECLLNSSVRNLPSGAFFQIMSHTTAANMAYAFGLCGTTLSPNSACTSSAQAIGLAYETIAAGGQEVMLCGGSEELHPIVSGSLDLVQAASWHYNDRPTHSPRPFDKDRDGTVCGEGGGALILEAEEVALARGAEILAEVAAYATTTDGAHLAESHHESIGRCLQNALDKAGLLPDEIDYINAHATGTIVGDIAEAQAISELFGGRDVPVSSLKGAIGHTLGASCALELIASIKMSGDGILIPTLNLESPGEGCEGVNLIREPQKKRIQTWIKNSFAFGGINTVLIIKRVHP